MAVARQRRTVRMLDVPKEVRSVTDVDKLHGLVHSEHGCVIEPPSRAEQALHPGGVPTDREWWDKKARAEPDSDMTAGSETREAMRFFECAIKHRWLEPYAQQGTYRENRACIVLGCTATVSRRIVSVTYR